MADHDEAGNEILNTLDEIPTTSDEIPTTSDENTSEGICIHGCKMPEEKKTVTCLMCAKNYHFTCVNFKSKAANPFFTCHDCRSLFSSMRQLCRDVGYMKKNVTQQLTELNAKIVEKEKNSIKLNAENVELRLKVASLNNELQQAKWRSFANSNDCQDLVLSDCLLSTVDSGKLRNTNLICVPDAKAETFTDELEKPEHEEKSYNRIVIVVGTNDVNDCKTAEDSSAVIPKFTKLIEKAKTKASEVCVSSVCPRLDQTVAKDRIDSFNANLQVLCNDVECDFTDNTLSFSLGDGTVNDGYLESGKGPLLSKAGVNKLVKNLKIQTKQAVSQGVVDVTKSIETRYPKQKQPEAARSYRNQHGQQNRRNQQRSPSRPLSSSNAQRGASMSQNDVVFNRNACYYCNEPGHRADICKHGGTATCHGCGAKGHKHKHHSGYNKTTQNYADY